MTALKWRLQCFEGLQNQRASRQQWASVTGGLHSINLTLLDATWFQSSIRTANNPNLTGWQWSPKFSLHSVAGCIPFCFSPLPWSNSLEKRELLLEKKQLLLSVCSYLERIGVEVLAPTTERRPGRLSSRGRRNGEQPCSCVRAPQACCTLSSRQTGRWFFTFDALAARRQGLTDAVKCFVPGREDEDLVTRLPLVSLCCSAFLLIVEPRSRAALSPDRRRGFGLKNAELTKGTRRISAAE